MSIVKEVKNALNDIANPEKVKILQSFFKTKKGEYAEGDIFIGVKVPDNRIVAKEYFSQMTEDDFSTLMKSPVHEHRLCALIMLIHKFEKEKKQVTKKQYVEWYLNNLEGINNWDLVDTSCYKLLGRHCFEENDNSILHQLASSENMWHRRIAIVATMHHVKKGNFELTKQFAIQNMHHPHDLMHKANGWLLREMGQKNIEELYQFLDKYATQLPRTSLRYAIEKLPEEERKEYLSLN